MDNKLCSFLWFELSLSKGNPKSYQRGINMVYTPAECDLNTQLNASGSGFGTFLSRLWDSMVSGRSTFIAGCCHGHGMAIFALAPDAPWSVSQLGGLISPK